MPSKTDGSFLPSSSQKPHKWGRATILLPKDALEDDFPRKVLNRARFRRHWPKEFSDQASSVVPSHNASSSSTWTSYNTSLLSSRPSTAPELNAVEPRYLSSALIQQQPRGDFKLFPQRPGTAPVFDPFSFSPEPILETPTMEIVECGTSFSISTMQGMVKIPRHNWLVLEPEAFPRGDEENPLAGRKLAAGLGGGELPAQGADLLRFVPQDRLHAKAAEANFKRASRGTCLLALRHAAYAMDMLSQRDREAETGAMSVPLRECPSRAVQLDDSTSSRLSRFSRLVKGAASAARNRDNYQLNLKGNVQLPSELGGVNRSQKQQLHSGARCLEDFHDFIHRRYGNSARAWFVLDPEENMKIGERMFSRRVLDMGFQGCVSAMYKYIDSDRSGSISLLELDSNAAIILAGFKRFIDVNFNGCSDKCFAALDRFRNSRVSIDDLVVGLDKYGYEGGHDYELFELLDRQGLGFIASKDINYFKKWKPRAYLFATPDKQALRTLKENFIQIHGNLWKAWRFALDIDCTMRVSWDEFFSACKQLWKQVRMKNLTPWQSLPVTETTLAPVWRALDEDCSGWIALSEFDAPCFKALKAFKVWATKSHGSCVEALRNLDVTGNAKLSSWELKKSDTRPNAYSGDVSDLFDILDLDGQRSIGEPEVKFLDDWDLTWEEYEAASKGRRKTTAVCLKKTSR